MNIGDLRPNEVWRHFDLLCKTPRASKQEATLRADLYAWGDSRGLSPRVDSAGNLILRKLATAGREACPGVILQAHLDMVCEKNAGTEHDFARDAIHPIVREGWLIAENTTLGADNGIGVALAMAVLEANDLLHGPLEVLLTVDEEAGMGGAHGLRSDELHGALLVNLDTEAWGEFYLGCAGGLDVDVTRRCATEAVPPDHCLATLAVTGLHGGHSGVDIHLERANAIKLLLRLIREIAGTLPVRLANFRGGTARNALAREAFATVAFPSSEWGTVAHAVAAFEQLQRQELLGVDDAVRVTSMAATTEASGARVIAAEDQDVLLAALNAAPHGVRRMSQQLPGVVETSNNFGILEITDGLCHANFMLRSQLESGCTALARDIAGLFGLIDAEVAISGAYPGWRPNPSSPLLALCQSVYGREFGGTAALKVIHAGLECGILAAKYPHLDMISFGPEIHGAHAPGERVEIASVGHAWQLLRAILTAIPTHDLN